MTCFDAQPICARWTPFAFERSAVFLASSASRSVGALPGVHVHAYASSPTRDDRAEVANRAAQARADHAQKTAAKLQQDRRATTLTSKTTKSEKSDKVDSKQEIMERTLSGFRYLRPLRNSIGKGGILVAFVATFRRLGLPTLI